MQRRSGSFNSVPAIGSRGPSGRLFLCFRALLGKEGLKQRAALGFANVAGDVASMIESRELQQIHGGAGRSGFRIVDPKNHSSEPDVNDGSGAHWARFFRDVERAIGKTPITDRLFGLS